MEITQQIENEFNKLLRLEKIEPKHLQALSPELRNVFMETLYKRLNLLDGYARREMMQKTMALLDNDFIWALNHTIIMEAIKGYARVHGTVPNNAQLAVECGLSYKTVRQHLKTFKNSEALVEQNEAMGLMRQNVIGIIMKQALGGDLKAGKLYLQATDPRQSAMAVNNQNNFIQINETVINQQIIQQLNPEQLQQIEQIIAGKEDAPELPIQSL